MTHRLPESRDLSVEALARVEGEGAMRLVVADGHVERVELNIYEPPRFFEALLRGRRMDEPVDITARICGICPVAYQMSACAAIEQACGVTVPGPLRDLRRLLYCGEWIESHALHIYLLHAPDFLGYDSAIELARDHREAVERGLRLRKAGNTLITAIGGRESHPVNVRLGGFYRTPRRAELEALRPLLEQGLEDALATVRLTAGFDFPELEIDHELVALREPGAYPIDQGRLASTGGLDAPVAAFGEHVVEEQVPHSTALHARLAGSDTYLVGPLARYALAAGELSPAARSAAAEAGLPPVVRNPYQSIVVRSVELVYAFEEALRLLDGYVEPDAPFVPVAPRAGTGHGATEAPRGILYHRYTIDEAGIIRDATIVPPTSQNQRALEADLGQFAERHLHLDDAILQWQREQAIRNYDPCISCATHFLDLTVERR
jgi:sulfhydrogenase subunit alpha